MRTRWDEVEEVGGNARRFFGMTPVTLGLAVPVAFIAGAAIMSFFDQSQVVPEPPAAVAAVSATTPAKPVNESKLAAEKTKWEAEAKGAAAQAAELQMQVEALRDQVSDEARRRAVAEQEAASKASELDRIQHEKPVAAVQPASMVTTTQPERPSQDGLAYTSASTMQMRPTDTGDSAQPSVVTVPQDKRDGADASNETIALQRLIEDAASRSAATSTRNDEMEVSSTAAGQSFGTSEPKAPRKEADVEVALNRATGLDGLSTTARTGLKNGLVAGECVAGSLEKVLGTPVPVVPLRNLVRDLNSDC